MPAIPAQSKVLVTGASGFIGAQTCLSFLKSGYSVRGTVRTKSKGQYLDKVFASFGKNFEWVVVPDLEAVDGFNEAVRDVQGIAHTASPFHFNPGPDPQKSMINPAVNGTLSVLKAAKAHGDQVKRVVITSSYAAINNPSVSGPHTFTEADWNTDSPKEYKEKGKDCPAQAIYRTSKTWAEQAAWDYVEKEKPNFDIVTLQPPLVLGNIIHDVKKREDLNTSVNQVFEFMSGHGNIDGCEKRGGNAVDVRDLANAHVKALEVPAAGGNRFAISKTPYVWQSVVDIISDVFSKSPELAKQFPGFKAGNQGAGNDFPHVKLDASKSEKVLGLKYLDFYQTISDTVTSTAERARSDWQ